MGLRSVFFMEVFIIRKQMLSQKHLACGEKRRIRSEVIAGVYLADISGQHDSVILFRVRDYEEQKEAFLHLSVLQSSNLRRFRVRLPAGQTGKRIQEHISNSFCWKYKNIKLSLSLLINQLSCQAKNLTYELCCR